MKKLLLLGTMMISGALVLTACSHSANNDVGSAAEEIYYADEDFMNSLAQGLQTRWDESESEEKQNITIGSDEHVEWYTSFVNDELEHIEQYKDEKFEDSELQEAMITYINCLYDQLEALDYAKVDSEKYNSMWTEAYNERSQLIETFVNDFGLTVDEEYQRTLQDMIANSKVVTKKENREKAVKKLVKHIEFEKVSDEYGYKEYSATVKNKTGIDFNYFTLEINLIDDEDVIVETTYAGIQNWKDGDKAKFRFGTEQDFTDMDITVDWISDS